jgi:hypothetical protein
MDFFERSREIITAGRTDETAGLLKAAATNDIHTIAYSGRTKICIRAAIQCFDNQTSENTQRM